MGKLLINTKEVQEALHIGKTMVFDLIKSGHLKPVKIGRALRFRVSDVEEYVNSLQAAA